MQNTHGYFLLLRTDDTLLCTEFLTPPLLVLFRCVPYIPVDAHSCANEDSQHRFFLFYADAEPRWSKVASHVNTCIPVEASWQRSPAKCKCHFLLNMLARNPDSFQRCSFFCPVLYSVWFFFLNWWNLLQGTDCNLKKGPWTHGVTQLGPGHL